MNTQQVILVTVGLVIGAAAIYHSVKSRAERERLKKQAFKRPIRPKPVEIFSKDLPMIEPDEKLMQSSGITLDYVDFIEYETLIQQGEQNGKESESGTV